MPCQLTETLNVCRKLARDFAFLIEDGRLFQRTAPLQYLTVPESESVRLPFLAGKGGVTRLKRRLSIPAPLVSFFFYKNKNKNISVSLLNQFINFCPNL